MHVNNHFERIKEMGIFLKKFKNIMAAVSFAEVNEHDTAKYTWALIS